MSRKSIVFIGGDLFQSDAQVIVIPVNKVSVAGKGTALQASKSINGWLSSYQAACRNGWFNDNPLHIHRIGPTREYVNFPTKNHWRDPTPDGLIEIGLAALVREYKGSGARSMALPALGAGCGKADWTATRMLMLQYLTPLSDEMDIEIFLP
jgi:O-acetyl-ADP-ribose deacetylase (regulator of RNase III)